MGLLDTSDESAPCSNLVEYFQDLICHQEQQKKCQNLTYNQVKNKVNILIFAFLFWWRGHNFFAKYHKSHSVSFLAPKTYFTVGLG